MGEESIPPRRPSWVSGHFTLLRTAANSRAQYLLPELLPFLQAPQTSLNSLGSHRNAAPSPGRRPFLLKELVLLSLPPPSQVCAVRALSPPRASPCPRGMSCCLIRPCKTLGLSLTTRPALSVPRSAMLLQLCCCKAQPRLGSPGEKQEQAPEPAAPRPHPLPYLGSCVSWFCTSPLAATSLPNPRQTTFPAACSPPSEGRGVHGAQLFYQVLPPCPQPTSPRCSGRASSAALPSRSPCAGAKPFITAHQQLAS